MCVFVTGITGYVGSHLLPALAALAAALWLRLQNKRAAPTWEQPVQI